GAADAEAELLSNLRALGYIGGDRGSAPASAAGAGETTQVFYHRNLATYFLKRRDYARAAEQLVLANEKQKLPKTYQMLAEAYAGLGRTDEAIAALDDGLRTIDSMDPEPVLWLVQMRLEAAGGRSAASEEARRFAPRTAKKPGLDDAIAGLIKESEGDAPAAVALFRRSLLADPTRVVAAQRLYALAGPESGLELEPILKRALGKDPRIDEYDDLLGAILATAGRTREALVWFRRAADLDPDNARFAANLASALARLGRWEEAAAAYERAAALESSPATFLKLGSAYRRLKRPDRALDAFERARAAGDAGAGPLLGIALSRADMHQIPEALAAVREGLGRHPDDPGLRSLYEDLLRRTRTPGSAPGPPGSGR
ncbi:MAG TPA: tetratricopeptide repeat protein, partial [Candidatus Polarisedimenticolia bacterium]|nr:tetratricopeptide repeat protein [Candidatus Polarisedimenticolia bacterium]